MKAVIYARYSSASQREESIEVQIRECTAFAEKNGYAVLKHYIDKAISGTTDNRPDFQHMLMRIQDQENTTLPLLEKRLKQTETGINNLLNAIQNGLFTPSTKERLESLEAEKAELEIQIEKERLVKPKISAEFMTFWLHRFRKLDVTQKSHRQMLIDTFVNAIYVYDDKLLLTYNFKEGTDTISLADVKNAAKGKNGSDLDCRGAPKTEIPIQVSPFFILLQNFSVQD